jgi:hypothetical protein
VQQAGDIGERSSERRSGTRGRRPLLSGQVRRCTRRGKQAWRRGEFARRVKESNSSGETCSGQRLGRASAQLQALRLLLSVGKAWVLADVSNQSMCVAPPRSHDIIGEDGSLSCAGRQMWRCSISGYSSHEPEALGVLHQGRTGRTVAGACSTNCKCRRPPTTVKFIQKARQTVPYPEQTTVHCAASMAAGSSRHTEMSVQVSICGPQMSRGQPPPSTKRPIWRAALMRAHHLRLLFFLTPIGTALRPNKEV